MFVFDINLRKDHLGFQCPLTQDQMSVFVNWGSQDVMLVLATTCISCLQCFQQWQQQPSEGCEKVPCTADLTAACSGNLSEFPDSFRETNRYFFKWNHLVQQNGWIHCYNKTDQLDYIKEILDLIPVSVRHMSRILSQWHFCRHLQRTWRAKKLNYTKKIWKEAWETCFHTSD